MDYCLLFVDVITLYKFGFWSTVMDFKLLMDKFLGQQRMRGHQLVSYRGNADTNTIKNLPFIDKLGICDPYPRSVQDLNIIFYQRGITLSLCIQNITPSNRNPISNCMKKKTCNIRDSYI